MIKRLVLRTLERWRTRQSRQIPYTELSAKHLKNLRTITDRETLLEHLPKEAVVAEVGVLEGDFSAEILIITRPKTLHLIDIWSGKEGAKNLERVKKRFHSEILEGRIILHQGSSTEVLKQFQPGTFDWLYLDTDHAYETTAAELQLSAKILKSNGLILGHDYVSGNWNSGVRYGVVEAVNEFCAQQHWEFIFLTAETHRHLSYALRVISDK